MGNWLVKEQQVIVPSNILKENNNIRGRTLSFEK